MKKTTFVRLMLGTVGGLLFSIGLCMCLLPQWNCFREGVYTTAVGAAVLLVLTALALKGRKKTPIRWKLVGKVLYAILSTLVLGVGICLVLVWEAILPGIVVGLVGIVMLLGLIPMCLGLH